MHNPFGCDDKEVPEREGNEYDLFEDQSSPSNFL